MELQHIALDRLCVSRANMRNGKKPPDISDILPSVRARGVLVPVLVRPNGSAETFESVAGRRRFHAALAVAAETNSHIPLPWNWHRVNNCLLLFWFLKIGVVEQC